MKNTFIFALAFFFSGIPFISNAQSLVYVPATSVVSSPQTTPSNSMCVTLNRGLSIRMSGNDVSQLQSFLYARGYLSVSPTGYFGSRTLAAIRNYQLYVGISPVGNAGPLTRARIHNDSCSITPVPPVTSANTPVINGVEAPTTLSVGQAGTWSVRATDTNGGGLSYTVVWGDEGSYYVTTTATSLTPFTQSSTFTHTYNSVGIFTPKFTVRGSNGLTVNTSVSTNVVAQSNQTPIINSVSPTSGAIGTTVTVYGSGFLSTNTVLFGGGPVGGVASPNGTSLSFVVPSYVGVDCQAGQYCVALARPIPLGINTIAVRNTNGTSNSQNFNVTSVVTQVPTMTSLSPSSGPVGTSVTLTGSGFSTTGNIVSFGNGIINNVPSTNDGKNILFNVPEYQRQECSYSNPPCLQAFFLNTQGVYAVSVRNSSGITSNSQNFTIATSTATTASSSSSGTLAVNQTSSINGLVITPLDILEDSRCPVDVNCIQAGRVVVRTRLATASSTTNVDMTYQGSYDQYVIATDGSTVKITAVLPIKYSGQNYSLPDYRVTYQVTR